MPNTESLPDPLLPRLEADFNEIGLSGDPKDNCCYVIYEDDLARISPKEGLKVFLWADDGDGQIIGCVAILEWSNVLRGNPRWRGRIDEQTWYRGSKL